MPGHDRKKPLLSDYYRFCWNWFFTPCNLAVTLMKHVACCHFIYVEGFISDVREIERQTNINLSLKLPDVERSLRTAVKKGQCSAIIAQSRTGEEKQWLSFSLFRRGKRKCRLLWPDWESWMCPSFYLWKWGQCLCSLTHREDKRAILQSYSSVVLLRSNLPSDYLEAL